MSTRRPIVSRARRILRRWSGGRLFVPGVVRLVTDGKLSYLDVDALCELHRLAGSARRLGGTIVEAGCALGGSAIVLAHGKHPEVPMTVHDVFGMIPSPGARDGEDVRGRYATIIAGEAVGIGGDRYYGYEDDLLSKVEANFRRLGVPPERHGVTLLRGLFEDTLHPVGPVALAHVDGDWYESVTVCLERICPWLVLGGRVVVDDYDAWSGCRRAVDDYLRGKGAEFRRERHARLHLVRTSRPSRAHGLH